MRSFHLAINGLADVVEQSAAFGDGVVDAELDGHQSRELRDFQRVHQHVLTVRRAIAKSAEETKHLGMNIGDAEGERGRLPFLEELLIELLTHLLDQLLDARGMDAAILHESFERDAGDLAANRIEAGENDCLGGVVDDEVDAGGQFQRADVAPFAADDAALHVLAREIDDGDGVLRDVIRGHALDGHTEDLARFEMALFVGLGLDALDDLRRFELGVVLDAADQLALRFIHRQAGHLFELVALRFDQFSELAFALLQRFLTLADGPVAFLNLGHAGVELLRLLVEILFLLLEAPLADFQLVIALLRLAIEIRPHLQKFFFDLEVGFLALRLGGFAGILEDAVGAAACFVEQRGATFAGYGSPDGGEDERPGYADEHCNHITVDTQNCTSPVGRLALLARKFGEPRLSRV